MAEWTISVSVDKPARVHDQRTQASVYKARKRDPSAYKNVDADRTNRNRVLVACRDTKETFDAIFEDAVSTYNAKQKRKDRRIDSYYQKCRSDRKMKTPIEEMVVQVGNRDEHPSDAEAIEILTDYFERWRRENANMRVMWATIHLDESTPHLHVCYAGTSRGRKNGLSLKAGMDSALRERGYRGGRGKPTARAQWQEDNMSLLEHVLAGHGHKRKKIEAEKRPHESVDLFKENEQLRREKAQLQRELEQMK